MLFWSNDYSRGLAGHMRPVTSAVRPASAQCCWLCHLSSDGLEESEGYRSQKIYRSSEENRSKWVLFRIAIYRSSGYNLIFCPAVSAELPGVFAPALPELLWLPTVWRCPYIEIAFSTLDCSIVPTCGAWCSATAAKRGPLKQSWAEIQHSRDDEPLGVLMQMRNVRVNGFFFFSSLGVLPGVLVDTLSLCSGDFCVECVLIVLHKLYIEL